MEWACRFVVPAQNEVINRLLLQLINNLNYTPDASRFAPKVQMKKLVNYEITERNELSHHEDSCY